VLNQAPCEHIQGCGDSSTHSQPQHQP